MNSPYESPDSPLETDDQIYSGQKLFKISGIGVATFFGGVLAGGYLLSHNFRKLGDLEFANRSLYISIAVFAGLLILIFAIPDQYSPPTVAINIAQTFAMVRIAKHYQQTKINIHAYNNRKFYTNWLAFAVALLVMLIVVLVAVVILVMSGVTV